MSKVVAISISKKKGVPKDNVEEAVFEEGVGMVGDAHAEGGKRQVSLLKMKSINSMKARAGNSIIRPGIFAENLTIDYDEELRVGERLEIGETVLEISQIGKECHTGCAISKQIGKCVMPKEGVFARVVKGGRVRRGDGIVKISPNPSLEKRGAPFSLENGGFLIEDSARRERRLPPLKKGDRGGFKNSRSEVKG